MPTRTLTRHLPPAEQKISLGQRRGQPDLARFSLDLTWERAESSCAAQAKDYPSPPMSGSPPFPPKPTHEAGGRSQRNIQSIGHDAYRGAPANTNTTSTDISLHQPSLALYAQPPDRRQHQQHQPHQQQHQQLQQQHHHYPPATPPSLVRPYPSYTRAEDLPARPMSSLSSYPLPAQLPGPAMTAYHTPYLPSLPGPGSMQQGYPASSAVRPPQAQIPSPVPTSASAPGSLDALQPYGSPKSQRKTKGHVASACVPCKRAHLRCDAQRPCSRCLSNGKDDSCVDVQHKKRGRPRLREERDLRYDLSGRSGPGGHPAEAPLRRPLPLIYGQPPASMGPGFIERGSIADANIYPPPLSISTRMPEPVAYLTMDLDIAKASEPFLDALGRHAIKGFNLLEVVISEDRERLRVLKHQVHDERKRRDPQYLPPIFAEINHEQTMQNLGFGPEEVASYSLDWTEYLTFTSHDGQRRPLQVRLGLAKQGSIYFVVLLLAGLARPMGHPTPSPHSREAPYSYQSLQHPPHHVYGQPTPVSATFDISRSRHSSDASYGSARQGPAPLGPTIPGMNPGYPASYSAAPGRPEYATGTPSYQTPRSELSATQRPHHQVPQSGFQLPPIRSRHDGRPLEHVATARDDTTRVDIGGLIDKPDPPI